MRVIKVVGRNRAAILEVAWPLVQAENQRQDESDLKHHRNTSSRKPDFAQTLEAHLQRSNMFFCHITPGDDPNIQEACNFMSFLGLWQNYDFTLPENITDWFTASVKRPVRI